jgi:hypothetical protein
MDGHDQAIKQTQSRDLDPTRFSDAGEDGGDFFHRILPFAENAVQSGVGDCIFHVGDEAHERMQ